MREILEPLAQLLQVQPAQRAPNQPQRAIFGARAGDAPRVLHDAEQLFTELHAQQVALTHGD